MRQVVAVVNVAKDRHSRPVFMQYLLTVRFFLDKPCRACLAGGMKSQRKNADARKEVANNISQQTPLPLATLPSGTHSRNAVSARCAVRVVSQVRRRSRGLRQLIS